MLEETPEERNLARSQHRWRVMVPGNAKLHAASVFCGRFDRVERVTKTYEEEVARRGVKRNSEGRPAWAQRP
jgi:hypothetical protein